MIKKIPHIKLKFGTNFIEQSKKSLGKIKIESPINTRYLHVGPQFYI